MKRFALIIGIFTIFLISSSNAQQRWERTYGGPHNAVGRWVEETYDGGYIAVGTTTSSGDSEQVYLIKVNSYGDTLWTRAFGGPRPDLGYGVCQSTDSGYTILGVKNYRSGNDKIYLIRVNVWGDTLWSKQYGGLGIDQGYSVQRTGDNGYIIAGYTTSFGAGNGDVYLIKTNDQGDTIWTRTYGGVRADGGYTVQQTWDGGYIIGGFTFSFGPGTPDSSNVYLIKTNAQGDTLWTKAYGASRGGAYAVRQTRDSGYIVAGFTGFAPFPRAIYLIKTDAQGDTTWTRTYGPGCWARSLQQTPDGSYVLTGTKFYAYLFKINALGDSLWWRTYGEGSIWSDGECVQLTQDGGYIIAGAKNSSGLADFYLIKTDANGSSGVEERSEVRDQGLGVRITAKPNPFTTFATLPGHEAERFSLYDISGRKVGTFRGDRVGEGLAPGVYFLQPENGAAKPLRIVKVR
jgi:hypothetical protein